MHINERRLQHDAYKYDNINVFAYLFANDGFHKPDNTFDRKLSGLTKYTEQSLIWLQIYCVKVRLHWEGGEVTQWHTHKGYDGVPHTLESGFHRWLSVNVK